jgi:sugar phosphate isomerase/epimerase
MDNFMIGFFGKCDEEKFKRDFHPGFFGVEAHMFPHFAEVEKLAVMSRRFGFHWGAHYPLVKKDRATRDPLFLSLIEAEREEAFADFENEVGLVARNGGTYLLTHIPKPALISDTFDTSCWRFGSDKEWMYERDYPTDALELHLRCMFDRLDIISQLYPVRIILEMDAVSSYLFHKPVLYNLFDEFRRIEACLDVGRLHVQALADSGFDGMTFAGKLAPYTSHIHLWNASPDTKRMGDHLPVSPRQTSADGFADIKAYLELILPKGNDKTILFEHQSQLLTDEELWACYAWVDGIQRSVRGRGFPPARE